MQRLMDDFVKAEQDLKEVKEKIQLELKQAIMISKLEVREGTRTGYYVEVRGTGVRLFLMHSPTDDQMMKIRNLLGDAGVPPNKIFYDHG